MKILLTGGSGFVGQNLVKYLNKYDIRILSRSEINAPEINDAGVIIHLAGKAHDLKKTADPGEYYRVNFELTKKLFDAFLVSDADKFIFVSSVKAAADSVDDMLREEVIANPLTHYGKSKLKAEEYIQSQLLPSGKSYYILRPCMIHGPGNKGNLNLLYKFVQKGVPYPLASFHNKRSFLSVDNLCFVIENLIGKTIPSGIYHVADDEPLSTNEVFGILANSLGKKPKLWSVPVNLVKALATIGDTFNLPLNTERLNKLTENYVVSNAKLMRALDLELPLSAKEGLMATANSFRQ